MTGAIRPKDLLALLATRRVCRDYTSEPLEESDLLLLLDAARWATSAGNTRVQRFLVLQDPEQIRRAKALAPGVLATPPAIIVICTDLDAAVRAEVRVERDPSVYIDVGTAAMSMMAEAHALGLGTCPATSFSQGGVQTVLGLPPQCRPEMLLLVGHPRTATTAAAPRTPRHPSRRLFELAYWERYGDLLPERPVPGA
jgi:albonoursin synthase